MSREPLDVRLVPSALAAWGMAAWGVGWSPGRAVTGAVLLIVIGAGCLVLPRAARHHRTEAYSPDSTGSSKNWADGGSALWPVLAAALLTGGAALAVAGLRAGAVQAGPVPELAADEAQVTVTGTVASDPVRREGQFAPYVLVRVKARTVASATVTAQVRSPLLVIGDVTWLSLRLGEHIEASGRLSPARGSDLAAVLLGRPDPRVVAPASWVYQGISGVRGGLTEAASPLPPAQAALVPALVDGDDSAMPPEVVADFKATGLTHLLAVSGSNLTLVLGFVLLVARWCGVRARWLSLVGLLAVGFFVLLARPEPSVLRAAAMGVVALAGLSAGGRRRGMRALCVAVAVLVMLDPWLAVSVGFLLSSLATAGILLLAPPWRDALARWMPRPLAEAVAVPLSAQLVCTPVVAAISAKVSMVAVVSNLLVAPAVGPTTVAGLIAGLVAMVSTPLGHLGGYLAGVPAWWIVTVARRSARLPGASIDWSASLPSVLALTVVCMLLMLVMRALLMRRLACLLVCVLMLLLILRPAGRLGWPPADWLLVVCDVGQGDGLVLNAGRGVAVVVDTGPDPVRMDRCLRDLDVTSIALVVLTHFHADHVDGLSGVLEGRRVAEIQVSPLADPPDRAATVHALAEEAQIPVTVAVPGERRSVGRLSWQVLGPLHVRTGSMGSSPALGPSSASGAGPAVGAAGLAAGAGAVVRAAVPAVAPGPAVGAGAAVNADPALAATAHVGAGSAAGVTSGIDAMSLVRAAGSTSSEGSAPNNASVVMRVDADGHVFLLSGDAEPEEESSLVAAGADLRADVFKVAHHGSADQDPAFIAARGAELAVISVGADNTYGHPTQETLDRLAQLGAAVFRTDLDGDIAIVDEGGRLGAVTSK